MKKLIILFILLVLCGSAEAYETKANFVHGTLLEAIDSGDTTGEVIDIVLGTNSGAFPACSSDNPCKIVVYDALCSQPFSCANREILTLSDYTDAATDTVTILARNAETPNCSSCSFAIGAKWFIGATAFIDATTVEGYDLGTMTNGYLCTADTGNTEIDCNTATSTFQTADATLTDIADGTIAENLVNTANPWADNEVSDDITAGNVEGYGTGTMTDNALCRLDTMATPDEIDCDIAAGTSGNILKSDGTDWSSSSTLSIATLDLSSSTSSIPWVSGTTATQTTEGQAKWDSDDNWITVGDGAATRTFPAVNTKTNAKYCTWDDTGKEIDCNSEGGSGVIGGATGSTDNALIRADGTGGATVQACAATCADTTGQITIPKQSGTAGQILLYEANSTDTNGMGWKGPASRSADLLLQLPDADPSGGQILSCATPSGTTSACTWISATGDVTGVGNCTGGDCLDGSSDGGTTVSLYDGDSHKLTLDSANLSDDVTLLLGATFTDTKYCSYGTSTGLTCNADGSGGMVYPTSGVPQSTGSAWGSSLSTDGTGDCGSGAVCLGDHTHSGYLISGCTGTPCLDGTADGGTAVAIYDGDSNKVTIDVANNDADATLLLGKTFTDAKWCSYSSTLGFTCNENAPAGASTLTGANAETIANGTDGKWSFTGVGGTNNEDLTVDLETTANTVILGTTTGVTDISLGSLKLVTTGVILGAVNIVTTTDGDESPTVAQMYGTMFIADNATAANNTDYTLPSAATGMTACFYDNGAGTGGIIIDAATGDEILLNGTGVGVADAIDSPGVAGDGANGDFICLLAIDATYWITLGRSGTWVDGGAD